MLYFEGFLVSQIILNNISNRSKVLLNFIIVISWFTEKDFWSIYFCISVVTKCKRLYLYDWIKKINTLKILAFELLNVGYLYIHTDYIIKISKSIQEYAK